MNKLLTKIVGVTLGLTMAIGVGVAVGTKSEAKRASAAASYAFTGNKVTFSSQGLSNDTQYSSPFTNAADINTFQVQFGGGGNDGKYYNTGSGIRTYGGGTVTVTALNSNTLTEVVFVFSGSSYAAATDNIDDYTLDDATGTWSGSASSITLTRPSGSGHWRLQSVQATISGGGDPEPETITVSYNANGGTGTMAASTVTDGSVTLRANAFTRAKHSFTGWNTDAGGNGVSYADQATINDIAASFTLYAQWNQTEFDIAYNANGGSGTMAASTSASSAAACTFVPPTNKVFSGWNTSAEGNGVSYAAGASLSAIAANTTLYAQWTNRPALSGLETLFYTLTCTNTLKNTDSSNNTSNTAYASTYNVVCNGVTWNAPGNQNNATWWRIGGAKGTTSRYIYSKTDLNSVNEPVSKIVFNHNGISNANLNINYVQLEVGEDSAFNSLIETIRYTPSFGVSTSGSFEFYSSSSDLWEDGSFYRFTIDYTHDKSSNYGLDVNSIQFFYDYVSSDYATNLSVAPTSLSPEKGDNVLDTISSDLTITAQVNGGSAAAYTNYSVSITRRDDSTEAVTAATVFTTGDKKVTITALDPTTQGGSTYESEEVSLDVSYTPVVIVGNKYALTAVNSSNYVFVGTISENRGSTSTYSNTPSDYGFVVEDGLYSGTVSFKLLSGTNAGKYISWTGVSAQLAVSASKTIQSSWVAFDDGGTTKIANASNEGGLLMMNGTGNTFSVFVSNYQNYKVPSFYLLGTAKCDTFASMFMKMDSYDVGGKIGDDNGDQSCETYYPIAKAVYNGTATGDNAQYNLSSEERALICDTYGLYADAYARLGEWARIQGDSFNGSTHVLEAARIGNIVNINGENSAALIIIVISSITLATLGGYFLIRRRKEN